MILVMMMRILNTMGIVITKRMKKLNLLILLMNNRVDNKFQDVIPFNRAYLLVLKSVSIIASIHQAWSI